MKTLSLVYVFRVHRGRWDFVMGITAKAVNRMLQLACRLKKNYIIDQTNVFEKARRRKINLFKEFGKKALVLVPPEEDYIARRHKQAQELRQDMPSEALLEMKCKCL